MTAHIFVSAAIELCFILNAIGKRGKDDFKKMIDCIRYMVRKIGVTSANYCLITFKKGKAFQHIRFDEKELLKNGDELLLKKLDILARNPSVNCSPALHDDFDQASEAFENQAALGIKSEKVYFIFFFFVQHQLQRNRGKSQVTKWFNLPRGLFYCRPGHYTLHQ